MRLGVATPEQLELPALHQRQRHAEIVEHEIDAAGHEVGQRRRRAAIRHVLEFHVRHHLEQLGGEMRRGAVALGG